jgi:hypothetical protein
LYPNLIRPQELEKLLGAGVKLTYLNLSELSAYLQENALQTVTKNSMPFPLTVLLKHCFSVDSQTACFLFSFLIAMYV